MKIRNGFVSNSSSSSFVVLGQEIKLGDAGIESHVKNGKTILTVIDGWDGPLLIEITNLEMLSYALAIDEFKDVGVTYLAYAWANEDQPIDIDFSEFPTDSKGTLDGGICDSFIICDMEYMLEYLAEEEDGEKIKEKAAEILKTL